MVLREAARSLIFIWSCTEGRKECVSDPGAGKDLTENWGAGSQNLRAAGGQINGHFPAEPRGQLLFLLS